MFFPEAASRVRSCLPKLLLKVFPGAAPKVFWKAVALRFHKAILQTHTPPQTAPQSSSAPKAVPEGSSWKRLPKVIFKTARKARVLRSNCSWKMSRPPKRFHKVARKCFVHRQVPIFLHSKLRTWGYRLRLQGLGRNNEHHLGSRVNMTKSVAK